MTGLVNTGDKNSSEVPALLLLSAEKTNRKSETGCGRGTVKVKSNDCQDNVRITEDQVPKLITLLECCPQ